MPQRLRSDSRCEHYYSFTNDIILSFFQDKKSVGASKLTRTRDDDLHLWCLRMTALTQKSNANALTNENVSAEITDNVLSFDNNWNW